MKQENKHSQEIIFFCFAGTIETSSGQNKQNVLFHFGLV